MLELWATLVLVLLTVVVTAVSQTSTALNVTTGAPDGCWSGPSSGSYRGNRSESASGRTCQRWDEQAPHTHTFFPWLYPMPTWWKTSAVTLTTARAIPGATRRPPDTRWEYCDIQPCGSPDHPGPPNWHIANLRYHSDPWRLRKALHSIVGVQNRRRTGGSTWELAMAGVPEAAGVRSCVWRFSHLSGWVLTAAHCVESYATPNDLGFWQVSLGNYHRLLHDVSEQNLAISRVIMHENYTADTLDNDIALIRLANDATLNDYVKTICLAPNSLPHRELRVMSLGGETQVQEVAGRWFLDMLGCQSSTPTPVTPPPGITASSRRISSAQDIRAAAWTRARATPGDR
ncbi:hypothetical protein Bbelb_011700 [Branchiostoma belcheri]|nr:hypothetical protein Bbelb_011700 [Branchiostoma belcheri]